MILMPGIEDYYDHLDADVLATDRRAVIFFAIVQVEFILGPSVVITPEEHWTRHQRICESNVNVFVREAICKLVAGDYWEVLLMTYSPLGVSKKAIEVRKDMEKLGFVENNELLKAIGDLAID